MILIPQPPFFAGLSGYVAEMGSAFLCAALGIVPTVRHADYLGSWLEVLRDDNRAIFRAASQASKAAEWLLAKHAEYRLSKDGKKSGDAPESAPAEPMQGFITERRAAA